MPRLGCEPLLLKEGSATARDVQLQASLSRFCLPTSGWKPLKGMSAEALYRTMKEAAAGYVPRHDLLFLSVYIAMYC